MNQLCLQSNMSRTRTLKISTRCIYIMFKKITIFLIQFVQVSLINLFLANTDLFVYASVNRNRNCANFGNLVYLFMNDLNYCNKFVLKGISYSISK